MSRSKIAPTFLASQSFEKRVLGFLRKQKFQRHDNFNYYHPHYRHLSPFFGFGGGFFRLQEPLGSKEPWRWDRVPPIFIFFWGGGGMGFKRWIPIHPSKSITKISDQFVAIEKKQPKRCGKLQPLDGTRIASADGGSLFDCRVLGSSLRFSPFNTMRDFYRNLRIGIEFDSRLGLRLSTLSNYTVSLDLWHHSPWWS